MMWNLNETLIYIYLDDNSEKIKNTDLGSAKSFKIGKCKDRTIKFNKFNFEKILEFHHFKTLEEFVWFSVLLGTKYVPTKWLTNFYNRQLGKELFKSYFNKEHINEVIELVKSYVGSLASPIQFDKSSDYVFRYKFCLVCYLLFISFF